MVSGSLISSPPRRLALVRGTQRLLGEPLVAKLAERHHPAFGKISDEVGSDFFAATATDVPAAAASYDPVRFPCQT